MLILNPAKCEYFDATALSPNGDIFTDAITSDGLRSHGAMGALTVLLFEYDGFDGPWGPPHPSIGAWAGDPVAMATTAPDGFTDITEAARDALAYLQTSVWNARFDSADRPDHTEENVVRESLVNAVAALERYPQPVLNWDTTEPFLKEVG